MNRQTQKILIISIAVSLAFFTALADAPFQVEWQQSFGGTNAETFGALTQTIDGGYVLAGTSRSGATGNKTSTNYGDYDYWVLKLDSGGSKLWENDFGATNTENLNALQPTDDGGYLLGGLSFSGISGNKTNTWYGSSDAWLIKLNSTGGMMWQRSFGGTNIDGLTAIRQTSDGGCILAGSSMSPPSGNKTSPFYGGNDAWILKLDTNGNKLWENSFGGASFEGAAAIEVADDGGYVFAGSSSSGISGTKTSPNYGSSDYWVVKLDSDGNQQWENTFGGSGGDTLTRLLKTSDHGYILAGYSTSGVSGNKTSAAYGGTDFWLVKIDSNGNKVWENSFGGSGNEELRALAPTSDGGFLIGGYSTSPPSGNKTSTNYGSGDYWFLKLDSNGNKLWEQSFGGSSDDYLYGLQETQDGGIILGGYSYSPVSGNKTTANIGSSDFWVIKLAIPLPQLTINSSGQQVILSWPSPSTGFVLEQNSALQTAGWSSAGTPNDDGTTKTVALNTTATQSFFRLRKP